MLLEEVSTMALSMNMMRLFNEEIASPFSGSPKFELGTFGKSSPCTSSDFTPSLGSQWKPRQVSKIPSFDEDSGLGMEYDMTEEDAKLFGFGDVGSSSVEQELNGSFNGFTPPSIQDVRRSRRGVRKSLFSGKRMFDTEDVEDELSPSIKKLRQGEPSLLKFALTNSPSLDETRSSEIDVDQKVDTIIEAVDRLTTENDLIADGSRDYCLPTVAGKHSDLKSISSETMANMLHGRYPNISPSDVKIVDCRYPYEFQGGHIQGASNLYTKDSVHDLLKLSEDEKPKILIFHCEFSSERGPKMFRFLRSLDRDLNKDQYPKLNYPEIYLLEGGYKVFYATDKTLCEPQTYKPMLHKDHSDDLRHFRLKSKSWAAGQDKQPRKSGRVRSRLSLNL